ncbi:hypothetical protein CNMCM7691_006400 [Aspergillus felis]|uniref:Uncharacterized protein n=1 Tax=Aspergillus felis TaxID=1287682 RepID=A0A8H6R6P8_9EURO|nr:hypothetical protein CNMCM7691_006400 [Aspergillus felis]
MVGSRIHFHKFIPSKNVTYEPTGSPNFHDTFPSPDPEETTYPKQPPRGLGQRLTGTNSYDNIVHICSGQFDRCSPEETAACEEHLEPTLKSGLQFFWDNRDKSGAIGLRFLRTANGGECDTKETLCAGFFRNSSNLERWSKRHASHLAILNGALRHAKTFRNIEMPSELHPLISQSVNDLHSLLHTLGPQDLQVLLLFDFYAVWPEGLAVLLGHGYRPTAEALCYAIEADCVPGVKLILACDTFLLDTRVLEIAGQLWNRNPDIQKLIVEAFISRRRRLQALAETQLPVTMQAELNLRPGMLLNRKAAKACELLKICSIDVTGLEALQEECVYRTPLMNLDLRNMVWDAGFCDVDEPNEYGVNALRSCSTRWEDLTVQLERAEWLVSRGADLYSYYYGSPTTHEIAERMAVPMVAGHHGELSAMSGQCVQLLHLILLDDCRDGCDCVCCAGGCFAFRIMLQDLFEWVQHATYRIEWYGPPLSAIFDTIDETLITEKKDEFYDLLAPRVIRFLTFCELGLTHTCDHYKQKMTRGRIHDIQEEEASLIAQLNTVVDELLADYTSSSLTLHQFLKDDWRDRMEEILSEMPNNREAAELRLLGVHIKSSDPGVKWSDLLEGPRTYYTPRWLFLSWHYEAGMCYTVPRVCMCKIEPPEIEKG